MKNGMKTVILVTCVMFCLIGCGKSEPNLELLNSIVGTWQEDMSDGTKTIVFNADMTFSETVSLTGDFAMSATSNGTYTLDGDTISLNYEEYGTISDYTIAINGNNMVLDNGNAKRELVKK